MEIHAAGNRKTLRRQPLCPVKIPANQSIEHPPKPISVKPNQTSNLHYREANGKENIDFASASPLLETSSDLLLSEKALSLAEELREARRRSERLRLEREKTETVLRQWNLALEKEKREAERRELEQTEAELKLRRLLSLIELRSLLRSGRINSLRQQEEIKRKERLLLGEIGLSMERCEADEEIEVFSANEKGIISPKPVLNSN